MVNYPVVPGAIIKYISVGVLIMENESGMDEKIIAVPVNKVDISFGDIKDISNLSVLFKLMVQHFFEHYKYLEKGK